MPARGCLVFGQEEAVLVDGLLRGVAPAPLVDDPLAAGRVDAGMLTIPVEEKDLVTVPVVDAPPVTTVIAWPAHSRSAAVAALVRTATRLRPVPRGHLRPVPAAGSGVDAVGRVRDDAVRM